MLCITSIELIVHLFDSGEAELKKKHWADICPG